MVLKWEGVEDGGEGVVLKGKLKRITPLIN
jgi:hypothetical protein